MYLVLIPLPEQRLRNTAKRGSHHSLVKGASEEAWMRDAERDSTQGAIPP